jgi:hypothetical protein
MPSSPFPAFILFAGSLWLVVTTLLGVLSQWFTLAHKYPNQNEKALLVLRGQSGMVGRGVRFNNVLRISVCPSGLRIGMMRVFGPFCRDFFVPWQSIAVERRKYYVMPVAEFRFGNPTSGKLILPAYTANRLAQAAGEAWPEKELPQPETRKETLRYLFYYWLLGTTVASAFFLIIPRIATAGKLVPPPWWIAVGFPAVTFGLISATRYFNTVRHLKDK